MYIGTYHSIFHLQEQELRLRCSCCFAGPVLHDERMNQGKALRDFNANLLINLTCYLNSQ
jgi:hypothetical protein